MHDIIKNTGVKNVEKHIADSIRSADRQFKTNSRPEPPPPSWKPPKPTNTDYQHPDETGAVPLQLSDVPDVDWNTISWNLLTELAKDEILHKKIYREL